MSSREMVNRNLIMIVLGCYGFDTTYRTNIFNLICAPFVGVNHHWQKFLLCVFKAFLESMGNQQPKTIFTYQDASMTKAISEVMPNISHRLYHHAMAATTQTATDPSSSSPIFLLPFLLFGDVGVFIKTVPRSGARSSSQSPPF
ncbi:hypothetical protein Lal_00031961 [Lupinus albus]|nr:hypothetical protein Lal_00031961 [Lupinus albus]